MILKAEFIDLQEPIFATMESTSQSFKIEGVESYSPPFSDHTKLINRDFPDQHPIDAITGLQEALDNKPDITTLSRVAFTGDMKDLISTLPTILYCGTSTEVVDC